MGQIVENRKGEMFKRTSGAGPVEVITAEGEGEDQEQRIQHPRGGLEASQGTRKKKGV